MTILDKMIAVNSSDLVKNLMIFLDESKAENIIAIDLDQKSPFADHLIVASGRSQRHLKGLGEKLKHFLHSQGISIVRMEGLAFCDWVLVDGGDVVIHLFRPEIREIYNIEKMWSAEFMTAFQSSAAPLLNTAETSLHPVQ